MNAIKTSIPEGLRNELTQYEREGGWFQNGLAEGREEGREEGHLDGKRQALLLALASQFTLTDEQRARIAACTSEDQLDRWLGRLLRIDSVEALLADRG